MHLFPVVGLAAGRAGAMTGLVLLPGGQAYVIRPCLLYTLGPVAQDRLDGIWRLKLSLRGQSANALQ